MGKRFDGFQFLIGRLNTRIIAGFGTVEAKFQFLIGRLNTAGRRHTMNSIDMFQFLIGRLNTRSPSLLYPRPYVVSIPYR